MLSLFSMLFRGSPIVRVVRTCVALGLIVYGAVSLWSVPGDQARSDRYKASIDQVPVDCPADPIPDSTVCVRAARVVSTGYNGSGSSQTAFVDLEVAGAGETHVQLAATTHLAEIDQAKVVPVRYWGPTMTAVGDASVPDTASLAAWLDSPENAYPGVLVWTTDNPTYRAERDSWLGIGYIVIGLLGVVFSGIPLLLGLMSARRNRRVPGRAAAGQGWYPAAPAPAGASYGAPQTAYGAPPAAPYGAPPPARYGAPTAPYGASPVADAMPVPAEPARYYVNGGPPSTPRTTTPRLASPGLQPGAGGATPGWTSRETAAPAAPARQASGAPTPAAPAGEAFTAPAPAPAPAAAPEPVDTRDEFGAKLRGLERLRIAGLIPEPEYERRHAAITAARDAWLASGGATA